MAREVLCALIVAVAVLSGPLVARADDEWASPEKDTPAARARRQTEIRIVVAGSALLVLGLVKWGWDLVVMLRRRRAAHQAPAPRWHESGEAKAPPAGAGWTYHPPPAKAEACPEAEAKAGDKDANATVRIHRGRKP